MFRSEYADVLPVDLPIHDAVLGRATGCKRVRRVTFIDGAPRAASGKILRRELRERRS